MSLDTSTKCTTLLHTKLFWAGGVGGAGKFFKENVTGGGKESTIAIAEHRKFIRPPGASLRSQQKWCVKSKEDTTINRGLRENTSGKYPQTLLPMTAHFCQNFKLFFQGRQVAGKYPDSAGFRDREVGDRKNSPKDHKTCRFLSRCHYRLKRHPAHDCHVLAKGRQKLLACGNSPEVPLPSVLFCFVLCFVFFA